MNVKGLLTDSLGPSLQHTVKPDRVLQVVKEFRVKRAKARCIRRNLKIEKYQSLINEMADSAFYDPRMWDFHTEIRRLSNLVQRDKLFIRRAEHDVSTRHNP